MSGPSAKIICDSVSAFLGKRLTTFEVTYHRWIHPEVLTHRLFSRNSASSRAIPVFKMLQKAKEDPAFPLVWTSEQRGMQGGDELTGQDLLDAHEFWSEAHALITNHVDEYIQKHPDPKTRLHKSRINRLLEPYLYHTVIITATDWDGFWEQRISNLAEPEIEIIATKMKAAYDASTPRKVKRGEWHLPYITSDDIKEAYDRNYDSEKVQTIFKMLSVARCARVSYLTHAGSRDWSADIGLYQRLVTATPPHWSPLEHVATPTNYNVLGNFNGWSQLRHLISRRDISDVEDLLRY